MKDYMMIAIKEARKSLKYGDVPVGAVLVENGKIIAKAHNLRQKKCDVTKHAEMIVLEKACKKKKTWHLSDCVLYVTLEPCLMCLSAINQARVGKVVFSLPAQKKQIIDFTEKIQGNYSDISQKLLNDFFRQKRK